MKLSKKQEIEVWQVYNKWLDAYLNGDTKTYNKYLDKDYHFIGSTNNEEFLNKRDTTNFFKDTADQLAGKCDLRNERKIIEKFEGLVFVTHLFDAWFKNGDDYAYYGRFRFTNTLKENKQGWRFIYQHFSTTDSKTDEGETIGFDKVNLENQELKEAIKRSTFELEQKNRELEVETALERIRTQAVAMKQSSDLLDIVVTMRNEFIKLGHEAHYFWHMMWLQETYEKAMTSGDGSKIGFVMQLPRHIHGDIPQLAKWEKSKKSTVVYTMNVDKAIDYVDKMVSLGDFKNIDPQAPTHNDIRHIGGLTFIMARTTHGEIGYSLPGVVKNPPNEDIAILVKFAGAFDLAHQRFLDLQKAEKQARETQIELALEKVRSRTMTMQHSDELQEASFLLDQQVRALGIKTWGCAFNIYGENESTEWFGNEAGILHTYTVPREGIFKDYFDKGQKGETLFIQEFSGKACVDHYEYMSTLPVIGDVLKILKETNNGFPTFQIDHVVYFKYGYLLFITREHVPEAHDIFKRFAKVFEQTYTRFLDLQKAEEQAREAEIETALEKVRSRTMAMQHSDELPEAANNLFLQVQALGIPAWSAGYNILSEDKTYCKCFMSSEGEIQEGFKLPLNEHESLMPWYKALKAEREFFVYGQDGEDLVAHYDYMKSLPDLKGTFEQLDKAGIELPTTQFNHLVRFNEGFLLFITYEAVPDVHEIFKRFGNVFKQTYTRFLDLKKAEAQSDLIKKEKERLEIALAELKATQSQLIQSEKMASLGELTAGIAHEIQNPLNFVNNFSEVSKELLDEMLEELENGDMEEVKAIMDDVVQNLEKINHHGKRADGIVKGMLQHSRKSDNIKEPTNINALTDEYVRLAYHGLRAKDKSFNATIETNYDENIKVIDLVPQDIGRVVLNLLTNAFYAVNKKKQVASDTKYKPTVFIQTKATQNHLEVIVRDNGDGIPKDVLNKIFQPFFTTKPTGHGTGLGLSMSYDIIKAHGGELRVETNDGEGSAFIIEIPKLQ